MADRNGEGFQGSHAYNMGDILNGISSDTRRYDSNTVGVFYVQNRKDGSRSIF